MTAGPNVLLIVLDCVRARNTDLIGREVGTTPQMAQLADDQFTNYTEAKVAAPWSLPSHVSIFTSTSPVEHRVTRLSDSIRPGSTVFSWLSECGYDTGVFTENPYLCTEEYGLDVEFDHVAQFLNSPFSAGISPQSYAGKGGEGTRAFLSAAVESDAPLRSLVNGVIPYFMSTPVGEVLERRRNDARNHADNFLAWSANRDDWAACLNFVDAHTPYVPTTDHNRFTKDTYRRSDDHVHPHPNAPAHVHNVAERLYDGCIRQVDAVVDHIVDALAARGDLNDTLVVVTADHGEAFCEPHEVTGERLTVHNGGFNEVHAHVPLLVKEPGQTDGGRVDHLASPVAFADRARGLVAGDAKASEHSVDGDNDATAPFAVGSLVGEYGYESNTSMSPPSDAIVIGYEQRDGEVLKYVRDRGTDRTFRVCEGTLCPTEQSHRLDDLLADLDAKSLRAGEEMSMTDDTRSRLEDLGYL
jgi:arylsulfatase